MRMNWVPLGAALVTICIIGLIAGISGPNAYLLDTSVEPLEPSVKTQEPSVEVPVTSDETRAISDYYLTDAHKIFEVQPMYAIIFYDGDNLIGKLSWYHKTVTFEGDAETSARIFFEELGYLCGDVK